MDQITTAEAEMNELIDVTDEHADPVREAERREARAKIDGAMKDLTLLQRALVELVHFEGLSLQSAAKILGVSAPSALSSLLAAQSILFWILKEVA